MIATRSTDFNQCLCPVPTVSQDVEFTRKREAKVFDHPFGQSNFGLKIPTSLSSFGMIEPRPEGEEEILIEQGGKDPLMTKDVGHVLCMVFMPTTSWDVVSCLVNKCVIDDKKENRSGCDSQDAEELLQCRLGHLLCSPTVLSQKPGKAWEGSMQERKREGLHHGRSVNFFTQLDEADDEGCKEFKRGA